jgi:hypothetical protein
MRKIVIVPSTLLFKPIRSLKSLVWRKRKIFRIVSDPELFKSKNSKKLDPDPK